MFSKLKQPDSVVLLSHSDSLPLPPKPNLPLQRAASSVNMQWQVPGVLTWLSSIRSRTSGILKMAESDLNSMSISIIRCFMSMPKLYSTSMVRGSASIPNSAFFEIVPLDMVPLTACDSWPSKSLKSSQISSGSSGLKDIKEACTAGVSMLELSTPVDALFETCWRSSWFSSRCKDQAAFTEACLVCRLRNRRAAPDSLKHSKTRAASAFRILSLSAAVVGWPLRAFRPNCWLLH
mmetsp:Transcript_147145/g.274062  ORF Transcript_147145/g.274062 Transcript_147145/m.274062 type:complete len:235 (-) Transcript_147145:38-742(-)